MIRVVAFLRGINLGARRLKMERLRSCFEELDLEGVDTFLASGNVVFGRETGEDPGELEEVIEDHLERVLGYPVDTHLRRMEELDHLLRSDAVEKAASDETLNPQVIFLRDEGGEGIREELAALETEDDGFVLLGREVLWLRRGGLSDSSITTRELEAALGGSEHTTRTLNTVRRIVARYGE